MSLCDKCKKMDALLNVIMYAREVCDCEADLSVSLSEQWKATKLIAFVNAHKRLREALRRYDNDNS